METENLKKSKNSPPLIRRENNGLLVKSYQEKTDIFEEHLTTLYKQRKRPRNLEDYLETPTETLQPLKTTTSTVIVEEIKLLNLKKHLITLKMLRKIKIINILINFFLNS